MKITIVGAIFCVTNYLLLMGIVVIFLYSMEKHQRYLFYIQHVTHEVPIHNWA